MARALAGGVDVGARVAVDERAGERPVDQDRQLARGRGEGFGLADADGQAAIEGPERRLASDQTQRGDAQDGGGAIGGRLGSGTEAPAAGDAVLGGEGEPGGEVVLGGPAREVGPDLGDQLEGVIGGDAIDLRHVDAGQVMQGGADVDVGFVPMPAGDAGPRQRGRGWRHGGGQGLEHGVEGVKGGTKLDQVAEEN